MALTKDYKDMTKEEKEEYWQSVFKKVEDIKQRAKHTIIKGLKVTLASGGHYSLEDVVNTPEKADLFMYQLNKSSQK
jgi:hypothetical protein